MAVVTTLDVRPDRAHAATLAADPFVPVEPLNATEFATFRRRAIFDCCKWDPQVDDACVLAPFPLVVARDTWHEVSQLASSLAREALAAERELVQRPELHDALGLPWRARRALRRVPSAGPPRSGPRIIRFDFHFTDDGWRISEANTDVPGGLNEASGFVKLLQPRYPDLRSAGDPAAAYVDALLAELPPAPVIALVHATAYSDDQQMMRYVADRLAARGATPHLASPAHLRWVDGHANLEAEWWRGPLDAVVRFFPSEWLSLLPPSCGWPMLFAGSRTPLSNPSTAILTQSKRFPLVWNALETALPTWRALLPETRDPRDADWRDGRGCGDAWVLKPALGRVGEGVAIAGEVDAKTWRQIDRGARWHPSQWIAQRRFRARPFEIAERITYPCLGVYTIDDRVAGAYGRVASRPLVDSHAQDAAVLVAS